MVRRSLLAALALLFVTLVLHARVPHSETPIQTISVVQNGNHSSNCTSPLQVLFIATRYKPVPHYGSTQLRGVMMLMFFNAYPSTCIHGELLDVPGYLPPSPTLNIASSDVCLCVKWQCTEDVIFKCRRQGALLVLDLLDNPILTTDNPLSDLSVYDLILVNNEYARSSLANHLPSVQIAVLYHQHSNLDGTLSSFSTKLPTQVLLLGAIQNLPLQDSLKELTAALKANQFMLTTQGDMPGTRLLDREMIVCKQVHHHHSDQWNASLGLIWARNHSDEYETKFRPVTRLVTAWSHGLPTAFSPFQSYLEVCEFALRSAAQDEAYVRLFGTPSCAQLGLCETHEEVLTFFKRMRDKPAELAAVKRVITHVASTYFSFETISLQLAEILRSAHSKKVAKDDLNILLQRENVMLPKIPLSTTVVRSTSHFGEEWWNRPAVPLPTCEIPLEFREVAQEAAAFTKHCALVVFTTVFFPDRKSVV